MGHVRFDASAEDLRQQWHRDGWFVVRDLLSDADVQPARDSLRDSYFPESASVWREPDPILKAEQFVGITEFPFWRSPQLNAMVLDERLYRLAQSLLDDSAPLLYQAQAWAKYSEAANYDQELHRDFRNHTLVVPDPSRPENSQLEMMVLLSDVTEDLGPTHLISRTLTRDVPMNPEFMPRADFGPLYELEESAAAPAGSVLVYAPDVVHRGTDLTKPNGSRFVVSLGFMKRGASWSGYQSWPKAGSWPPLIASIVGCTPLQLRALGFPLPDDPYWTAHTRQLVAERYPGLDLDRYFSE